MELFITLILILLIGAGVFILIRAIEVGGLKQRIESLEERVSQLSRQAEQKTAARQEPPPSPERIDSAPVPAPGQAAPETEREEAVKKALLQTDEVSAPKQQPAAAPTAEKESVGQSLPDKTAQKTESSPAPFSVSLEYFVGAKLFAWLGGFALFLGLGFFVKYSIDNNLVSPELRVGMTYAGSLALLVAGFFTRGKKYAILSHTLLATGVLVLYLATCAARLFYEFPSFTTSVTGAALIGTTLLALILSVRLRAQVIAILGLVGGFLTPWILATGQDHTNTLFCYICLLNAGLITVIRCTKWHYLSLLGAVFTIALSLAWADAWSGRHFFALFNFSWVTLALYTANAFFAAGKEKQALLSRIAVGVLTAFLSLILLILIIPTGKISEIQHLLLDSEYNVSLVWVLLFFAIPGAAHAVAGIRSPFARGLFPLSTLIHLSCLSLLLNLSQREPLLTGNGVVFSLALLFGLIHFGLGLKFNLMTPPGKERLHPAGCVSVSRLPILLLSLFPAGWAFVSCLLVFLLPPALQATNTLPPTLQLCLAAIFSLLFLASSLIRGKDILPLFALAGAVLSSLVICSAVPHLALSEWLWVPGTALALLVFPFLFSKRFQSSNLAWSASAYSLPLFYMLFRSKLLDTVPTGEAWTGALALLCGLLTCAGALRVRQTMPKESPLRNSRLSLYFAVSLGFLTLFFGEQFRHEYLTVAWSLEGAALLWLYLKLPEKRLVLAGALLLIVSFLRLTFNEDILSYHPASGVILLNWYLPVYALAAASCHAGARFLRKAVPPCCADLSKLLDTLGAILLFVLVNLEIADAYTAPGADTLAFHFGTSLACDLTYSIAWGIFALCLLLFGLCKKVRPARLCGLILLAATMLKVFLYDLAALEQLYRVGALVGLALIALAASFLYQKYNARHSGGGALPPTP